MAKMTDSDSDSESESDINKKKLLLREKQRKKIFFDALPLILPVFLVSAPYHMSQPLGANGRKSELMAK